jgi:transposase
VCWRIARGVYDALDDDTGVPTQRHGVLERIVLIVADWHHTRDAIADVEARMVAVLDELELTDLVTSIDGLSAVGAATILAETGDLTRYPPPGRWSSTPGCAPATTAPASSPATPRSPAAAAPRCGWPPGGPCGARCPTTPCSPPATSTSPPATATR